MAFPARVRPASFPAMAARGEFSVARSEYGASGVDRKRVNRRSDAFVQDPYPTYASLRSDAPVFLDRSSKTWYVSRHEDVCHVLRDPHVFSSEMASFEHSLVGAPPDVHKRTRPIIARAMSARWASGMEDFIHDIAVELLDTGARNPEFDFVGDFAQILPMRIFKHFMDLDDLEIAQARAWAVLFMNAVSGPELERCQQYFRNAIERQSKCGRKGLITHAVATHPDDQKLTMHEGVEISMLLMLAATVTTTNLISSALKLLVQTEASRAAICDVPGYADSFIEEVLRFESPVQAVPRVATCTTTIDGVELPKGARVELLIGSANRDERVFSNPDDFDMSRNSSKHIAFGFGPHFCLGAQLGRLEAKISLQAICARYPGFRLEDPAAARFAYHPVLRGVERLPVFLS